MLDALERPGGTELESEFEALRMLVNDAMLSGDDASLRLVSQGLHRLLWLWSQEDHHLEAVIENRGELRAIHNQSAITLERIIPLEMLAQLAPGSLIDLVLQYIVANPGCSNDDLVRTLARRKEQVSRAGRQLHDSGLARKRRTGKYNSWEATPRGHSVVRFVTERERSEVPAKRA